MTQEVVHQMSHVLESVLDWSKAHPGATLQQLEEQVGKTMDQLRAQLLEAAIAQQGRGQVQDEHCTCGAKTQALDKVTT